MNEDEVASNPNIVAHLILTQVVSYSRKLGASKENPFIIAMDSSPSWRHDYYLENRSKFPNMKDMTYKGNRKSKEDEILDWKLIKEIALDVCEALKSYSDFHMIKIDRCEADDIIAVLANNAPQNEFVWIVSSDKDFVQLQSDKCKIFDPLKQLFKPEQNIDLFKKIHTIIGDKSDNILAIKPRTGEKTALKLLNDLDDMLATDPDLRARYKFNEDLILFENIPSDIKDLILSSIVEQERIFNFNTMGLIKTFMKYNLVKHTEDVYAFRLPNSSGKNNLTMQITDSKKNESIETSNLEDFFS